MNCGRDFRRRKIIFSFYQINPFLFIEVKVLNWKTVTPCQISNCIEIILHIDIIFFCHNIRDYLIDIFGMIDSQVFTNRGNDILKRRIEMGSSIRIHIQEQVKCFSNCLGAIANQLS
jgi:hypothetical protein